jgi:hypothetical protein
MQLQSVGIVALVIVPWFCTAPVTTIRNTEPPYSPAVMSELVREIARPGCGSCHTGSLPTAKAAALEVFDLDQLDWSGRMTAEQLESFGKRFRRHESDSIRTIVAWFVQHHIDGQRKKTGKMDRQE